MKSAEQQTKDLLRYREIVDEESPIVKEQTWARWNTSYGYDEEHVTPEELSKDAWEAGDAEGFKRGLMVGISMGVPDAFEAGKQKGREEVRKQWEDSHPEH